MKERSLKRHIIAKWRLSINSTQKGSPEKNSLGHKIITDTNYYYLFSSDNNKRKKLCLLCLVLCISFSEVTPDLDYFHHSVLFSVQWPFYSLLAIRLEQSILSILMFYQLFRGSTLVFDIHRPSNCYKLFITYQHNFISNILEELTVKTQTAELKSSLKTGTLKYTAF